MMYFLSPFCRAKVRISRRKIFQLGRALFPGWRKFDFRTNFDPYPYERANFPLTFYNFPSILSHLAHKCSIALLTFSEYIMYHRFLMKRISLFVIQGMKSTLKI